MNQQEILSIINNIIKSENGLPVRVGNLFIQSELDSLGTMIVLVSIAAEFNISAKELDDMNIEHLTVENLLTLCESSIIAMK